MLGYRRKKEAFWGCRDTRLVMVEGKRFACILNADHTYSVIASNEAVDNNLISNYRWCRKTIFCKMS